MENLEASIKGKRTPDVLDYYKESKKYLTDLEHLQSTLVRYGVAILPQVLDEKESAKMLSEMWDYLELVSEKFSIPIRRNSLETWKEIRHLWPLHSMLLKQFGIGHCQMIWNLRQNPKIMRPFSVLWETKESELLTSFDGASFHMPPEITKQGWSDKKNPFWWHTDQSYLRNDFECVQSWVTATDVKNGDATLAVLEGSHQYHKEFGQTFKIDYKSDWYKLANEEQIKWYQEKGCIPALIECPAGSMVFWDSRTIHCGFQACEERRAQNIRCVGYICMTPRSRCSAVKLKKRIKAFETLRTSSHWPEKIQMNPNKPRTYGRSMTETVVSIPSPVLSDIGRRLVGYA
jgi:hypothetical protein